MPSQTQLQHTGTIIKNVDDIRLIDCTRCGFIHVDPLPTVEALAEVYDEKFYAEDKPQYLEKSEREQPYWREAVYRPRFDVFERLITGSPSELRVLDIGCSGGFFLKYGKERGWQTVGIEPSRQAAHYARTVSEINVHHNYFQNVSVADLGGPVDVVHLRNVLEHLPNPIELCEHAYACLKPGGIICLEVPNDFNPLQKLAHEHLGATDYWVSIPHHLNYFSAASLRSLLERVGFGVVHQESTFPIELFLLMGENYVGNNDVGLECHTRRMNMEKALAATEETRQLMHQMYQAFAELGIGRTIIQFARKPL